MAKNKRTKPAANSESETDPAKPPTFRRIIPAEPEYAFWNLSKLLSDLLCWATHPIGKTLNIDWRESYKNRIRDVADATIRSVEHRGDDSLVKKIKTAQRLGFQFATLLCDRPDLSTVAVENWTVPRYRQLFDDLSALEREFKLRGDGELPTPLTEAKAIATVATTPQSTRPWHTAEESPPSEYPAGPLTGTKQQLAKWIMDDDDPRNLDTKLANGSYWGREETRRRSSIWFKSKERYSEANVRRLADPN